MALLRLLALFAAVHSRARFCAWAMLAGVICNLVTRNVVPFQVSFPDVKKTDDRPFEEILSNYHDLQAHLAKGKYAGLLGA